MTLLFFDGFDCYNTATDFETSNPNIYLQAGSSFGYTNGLSKSGGRFDGGTLVHDQFWGGPGLLSLPDNTSNDIWVGKAFWTEPPPWQFNLTSGDCFYFYGSSIVTTGYFECFVYFDYSTGEITAKLQNGTVLGTTTTPLLVPGRWSWVECRCKLANSPNGIIEVYINGTQVLNLTGIGTDQSGTSTRVTGVNLFNKILLSKVDDMYVLNTDGLAPWNDRLGDCRIATLLPNGDAGPNNGTPATGSSYYSMVNERSGFNTSTVNNLINLSNTTGQQEVFDVEDPPQMTTIFGVAVCSTARKTLPGLSTYHNKLNINNTDYISDSYSLSTSYATNKSYWVKDPSTNQQWTANNVAASKMGIDIE